MAYRPLHIVGPERRCATCAEPFPCPASIAERELSHQVMPSASIYAGAFEQQLRPMLESLKAFQRELQSHHGQERGERGRYDKIVRAIKHLEQALDALRAASRD